MRSGSKRGARPYRALLAIGRALAFTLNETRIYHRMPSREDNTICLLKGITLHTGYCVQN